MTGKNLIGIFIFILAAVALSFLGPLLYLLSDKNPCNGEIALAPIVFAHEDLNLANIIFKDDGVSPPCDAIISGGKVVWVNNSAKPIQVSSDPHPIHTDNSEISDGKFVLQLEPGQSATITLTKKGNFGFHDHLKPNLSGRILVK